MNATSMASATADATERNGVRAEAALPEEPATSSLFSLLGRLWSHLAPKRRWQLVLLLAVMIASGFAEVASLAAVVPLLTVLADPDRLWQVPWIREQASWLGISTPRDLLLPATVIFAVSAIASAAIRLANLWLSSQVAGAIGGDLAHDAYRRTLYQPYAVHTARNSSTVLVGIFNHIYNTISGVIYPCMQIVSCGLIIACIVAGLLAIDRLVAVATMATFGVAYGLISFFTKQRLVANSRLQAAKRLAVSQAVHEGLGSIRDILLDQSQKYHVDRFSSDDRCVRGLHAEAEFLGGFPRFLIEGVAMAGIAVLSLLLVRQPGGLVAALPVLGSLALGAQRLLPAVQQAYASATSVRACTSDLEATLALLDQPAPAVDPPAVVPAAFRDCLTLDNVSFRYQHDLPLVLRDASLVIPRGERVALVGPTGSGKSTLADILMGLLTPTAGRLLIDGRQVSPEAWQANIAHVPQSIFLADTSVAENIALGIPAAEVDQARLKAAAVQAQIADFIESLPKGYATTVGERGVRLSGGQRQRIGIARALYKQAPVLVFDEATSALDDATEKALMETLDGLSRDLTIIMIAHRLSTTAYCDRVITVSSGCLLKMPPPAGSSVTRRCQ
jgi:ATP-binding cassette, subfamily B, bacterial PglK